jgi:hypothetical protein
VLPLGFSQPWDPAQFLTPSAGWKSTYCRRVGPTHWHSRRFGRIICSKDADR